MLTIGIRLDQTRINGKAFPSNQTLFQTTVHRLFKNMAQQITIAKAPVAVLGKRRMIGNATFQAKSTKPAIGKIQMNLFAQTAFRANAAAISNDQHTDHQFRINGRAACRTVKIPEVNPHA